VKDKKQNKENPTPNFLGFIANFFFFLCVFGILLNMIRKNDFIKKNVRKLEKIIFSIFCLA